MSSSSSINWYEKNTEANLGCCKKQIVFFNGVPHLSKPRTSLW